MRSFLRLSTSSVDRNHTYTPHLFHFHVKAVIFWPLHDSTSRNPQFQFQLSPILPFFRHHGFRWLELLTFKLSNNRHNSINPSLPTSQKRARSLGSSGRLSGSPTSHHPSRSLSLAILHPKSFFSFHHFIFCFLHYGLLSCAVLLYVSRLVHIPIPSPHFFCFVFVFLEISIKGSPILPSFLFTVLCFLS